MTSASGTAPNSTPNATPKWLVHLFRGFLALGILFLSLMGWTTHQTKTQIAQSVIRPGRVLELVEVRRQAGEVVQHSTRSTYAPRIEFELDGQTYAFTDSTSSYPPAYDVGEEVEVLVDPASPYTAHLNTFFSLYILPFVLGVLGFVFTLTAAIGLRMTRPKS